MKIGKQEPFEKPDGGEYAGRIIDVIEKPNQAMTYNGVTTYQDQVTITWVLGYTNGQPYLDSKGRPFQVFETYNAYMTEPGAPKPSKLYVALTQILNAAPPTLDEFAQLESLLLNRTSGLFVQKSPKVANPTQFTSKVIGHNPLKPGQVAPEVPKDFKRAKDRTKTTSGPRPGQQSQTFIQPPQAAPQQQSVNLNADSEAF